MGRCRSGRRIISRVCIAVLRFGRLIENVLWAVAGIMFGGHMCLLFGVGKGCARSARR